MTKFNGIMKLTEAQFSELSNNGTITVGGITYTYDPNGTLYVTDDTSGGGSSQLYVHNILYSKDSTVGSNYEFKVAMKFITSDATPFTTATLQSYLQTLSINNYYYDVSGYARGNGSSTFQGILGVLQVSGTTGLYFKSLDDTVFSLSDSYLTDTVISL